MNTLQTEQITVHDDNGSWVEDLPTPAQPPQTSHSPLPWLYNDMATIVSQDLEKGQPVACISLRDWKFTSADTERCKANAAFIVRACNNAQRLADALKRVNERLEIATNWIRETAGNDRQEEPNAIVDNQFDIREAREALAQYNEGK